MASWRSKALLDVLSQEQTEDIGGSAPGTLQSSLQHTVAGADEGDHRYPPSRPPPPRPLSQRACAGTVDSEEG